MERGRRLAVWPGRPHPLGANWDGGGVNFALFSQHAERVDLCIFEPRGRREVAQIPMRWQTDFVWHCYLPEARPGLFYGYRVYGPYDPERGLRFNPNKVLIDPYAKAVVGDMRWSDAQFGYRIGARPEDLSFDRRNSAPGMPKCEVVDTAFSWGDDRRPRVPLADTVIYELHVKGFTYLHRGVPDNLRGTYLGLASDAAIAHLRKLGVTAVELMPIHAFVDDRHLVEKGLRNYWGYNSIAFFAPDLRYTVDGHINEFKTMVKRLHEAGIEVILDVVYNHTAEGNHLGPTLSFRGIDNAVYYRLVPKSPRYYLDFTGCGNTLNMMHPQVLKLVMDSLRYWVEEMHVDGFRFDLASALAREHQEVDHSAAFFDTIHQDPVVSQVKLIAEPWDLGERGYQVGKFPLGWSEWNGRYRDAVRAYWQGEPGMRGELASRLAGSSDLYEHGGRRPYASINFITAHDGFTLLDLVSYNEKHNEDNLEGNRDGAYNNLSWNCGAEGHTDDPQILALRFRQRRNLAATLLLSQGVPMLLAGDELGHTQHGNNNAYCQDNTLSWLSWSPGEEDAAFARFVEGLLRLRREHPAFRRRRFLHGRVHDEVDILWLRPEGGEMAEADWQAPHAWCFGMLLLGSAMREFDARGERLVDDDFLLILNGGPMPASFQLPEGAWGLVFDTAAKSDAAIANPYLVEARSCLLFTRARSHALRA